MYDISNLRVNDLITVGLLYKRDVRCVLFCRSVQFVYTRSLNIYINGEYLEQMLLRRRTHALHVDRYTSTVSLTVFEITGRK